jgi:hypothetical protein
VAPLLNALVSDVECGVRHDRTSAGVAEPFYRPLVAEAKLCLAHLARRGDLVFALPFDQRVAELSAVGEHPGVELDVVEGAAVVEDVAGFEAGAGVDDADVAEEAVSGGAEEVGPFVGAAGAVGAEAFEVASAEESYEPAARGLDRSVGPPQFAQLVCG